MIVIYCLILYTQEAVMSINLNRAIDLCRLSNRIYNLIDGGIPPLNNLESWFDTNSNMSSLIFKNYEIFLLIDLNDLWQQKDVSKYFVWLRDNFIPFLEVAKKFIPNVHFRVDNDLEAKNVPRLHQMLSMMTTRFRHEPMRFFCSMLLCKNSPRANCIVGFVIAQFNGNAYLGSEMIAGKLGLTPGQLKLQLFPLRNLPRIEGKYFWRKIRVISIILNFLIKMLVPESWLFQTTIRNRVLRRLTN